VSDKQEIPSNISIEGLQREKTEEEKQKFYIDDYALTKLLLKEQEEYKNGLRTKSSEELAKNFITVLEHVLTARNFSGYSKNYKDEFRSKAYLLFVKHWHKFDPAKARLNYYQKDGELFYKENVDELRGGFGWFSLFARTAALDEIKRFKRIREKNQEIIDGKNADLENIDSFLYQE